MINIVKSSTEIKQDKDGIRAACSYLKAYRLLLSEAPFQNCDFLCKQTVQQCISCY